MNFFTTPNSKNVIATLRIVKIEKSELTFLLVLCFYENKEQKALYYKKLHSRELQMTYSTGR